MEARRCQLEVLAEAGRLLLENNESTAEIDRALKATARSFGADDCGVAVSYGGLAVALGQEGPLLVPAGALRFNMAVQERVHSILDQVRRRELEPETALAQLKRAEVDAPRHSRWVVVGLLGSAAASLALLLGADPGAALTAGVATAVGLACRQELGRRHFSALTLPLVAALIGGILGGLVIRLGWTQTPGLALIVPALILVPGPHFINGTFDFVDNYVPMGIARLGLAAGIVISTSLGTIIGMVLTLQEFPNSGQADASRLNLASDMFLAGIVTCGFAAAYNTPWKQLAMAAIGGMAGHGLRYLALAAGWSLDAATFLGGLGVGVVAACIARSAKLPVAVIAYAGAVTMMPGLSIYRALGGAFRLARQSDFNQPSAAEVFGNFLQACAVVGALALGLVVAARLVQLFGGSQSASTESPRR